MKRKLNLLLIILIVSSLFLIFTPISKVKASINDIDYTFEKETLFNTNSSSYSNSFNVRNPVIFSEVYNASYSFTNDTIGLTPDYFNITTEVNTYITINETIGNHNKVVEIYDNNNSGRAFLEQYFVPQVSGTIEYWIRTSSIGTKVIYAELQQNGVSKIRLRLFTDVIAYYDGAWQTVVSAVSNKWYHIRIDFESGAGGYLGLGADRINIDVNGIRYETNVDFGTTITSINNIEYLTHGGHTNYRSHIDGIGYSWLSNYTIGKNMIPFTEINSLDVELNRYEFAFEGFNDIYELADDNPSTWLDWEVSGDNVNIYWDDNPYNYKPNIDRTVLIQSIGTNTMGLWKDNLGITSQFINITYALDFSVYNINDGIQYSEFYSSDNTKVVDIGILKIGGSIRLSYFTSSYQLLYDGLNLDDYYEFNLFIQYDINLAYLILYENGISIGSYNFPLLANEKEGLRKIKILGYANTGNEIKFQLDYVGIYISGVSYDYENVYGFLEIPMFDNFNWYFNEHNLFTINANGTSAIYKYTDLLKNPYSLGESDIRMISDFNLFDGLIFINIYDFYDLASYGYPSLLFFINTDSLFSFSYVNIEGVSLNEGSNQYWLNFTHSGVDINESYFYVDSFHKLQFTLTTSNTDLEYIQAEFNIVDTSSLEYAIKFRSNIDSNALGFFRVNFTDISDFIPIPIYDTTTRVFITQNKTISSFIILITDDDIDSILGTTEGYLSELELLFISRIGVSITTTNLLALMIPIILIFIPTFLISSKFGKKSIVPLMILFTLVITITEIIPLWLFFIVLIPSSLFLFLKRKEGVF